ncbi:MAG TPA: hypothetical protein PKA55_16050 [Rhodoblastus sp.]|nr:hypothetical protein [Rhodoblastus sp.]
MKKSIAIAPAMLAFLVAAAVAQPAPSTDAPKPAAPAASPAVSKRANCRAQASSLRGPERADSMQLCMEEARLDCLKQAIAEKVVGAARKDYLKSCVGS